MFLSFVDRFLKLAPPLKQYYFDHYADIRLRICRIGQALPLVKLPRYVHFLLTFDCNFNCKQCQVDACRRDVRQLSYTEVLKIIDDIKETGVRHLIFTGGEPLVRDDVFDILRYADKVGIPRITLATNGYLVEKYQKELSELRIDRVVTSIDDVGERNDAVRGKAGAFASSLKALEIFKKIGVKVREINTTVFPNNVSHIKDLAEHVVNSSATNWVLGMLIPIGRASQLSANNFVEAEILELIDMVKKLRAYCPVELMSHTGYLKNHFQEVTSEPFFCRAGRECCAINPDGEVLPCNITSDIRFSQGNVREKRFKSIWEEGFQEFRHPRYPEGCLSCKFLSACGGGCWGCRVLNAQYCYKSFCS